MEIKDFELKDDEYIKDDLIFCKTCNTPRLWKSEDGEIVTKCLCSCQTKARDISIEAEKAKQKMLKLERLRINSLLGTKYKNSSFENLDLKRPNSFVVASKRCKKFCDNWELVKSEGCGIYLFGTVGTGKTELSACICNYLMQRYIPVLITNFLEVSKDLRASYHANNESEMQIIDKLTNIDLLVIDDIGTEKLVKQDGSNSFMQEKVFDIINLRYINKMPTIFTSNYSLNQLITERGFEQKVVDRIAEMSQAVIKLEGTSYRRELVNRNQIF